MNQKLTEAIIKGLILELIAGWYNTILEEEKNWKEKYLKVDTIDLSRDCKEGNNMNVEQMLETITQWVTLCIKRSERNIGLLTELKNFLDEYISINKINKENSETPQRK